MRGDRGIFLEQGRRTHPDVCRFVSGAVYDGRLGNIPETARHRVIRRPGTALVHAETGIVWVPVPHDGCTQQSEEQCGALVAIAEELLARRVVGRDGVERPMTPEDILPNRLNVAVSRAEALAVVVGHRASWTCGAGRGRRCGW